MAAHEVPQRVGEAQSCSVEQHECDTGTQPRSLRDLNGRENFHEGKQPPTAQLADPVAQGRSGGFIPGGIITPGKTSALEILTRLRAPTARHLFSTIQHERNSLLNK